MKADDYSVDCQSPEWWTAHNIDVRTRSAVAKIDAERHEVTLVNKSVLRFDRALVATGAMVRRLNIDGAALKGIHYLRTPMNARNVLLEAAYAKEIVLVGGSFIAVEVAASLTNRGHHCTMIMQEGHCMERTFGPTVAAHVERLLRSHGIDMINEASVSSFEGTDRVEHVMTDSGLKVPADLVVVGAGAVPDVKLARNSGLELGPSGGVLCDSQLRTSLAGVFAAGDMCEYASVIHGRPLRVEHEEHAIAQGITAARNMLGAGIEHTEVPYFWTDIADWTTLEYVGPAQSWDEELITGSVDDSDFTVWYFDRGRLAAALTSGRPQDLEFARSLIDTRTDSPQDLKSVIASRT